MSDLSLRRVRYFVTVAQELNFGRAAELLHLAQPVLSRQIAVLERELGTSLFDRSTRGTALSESGRALLEDARALLAAADTLEQRARFVARGVDRFAIGFMPGLVVSPLVQVLTDRLPGLDVQLVRTSWDDQVTKLHDGQLDVSLVRLPVSLRGLRSVPLFSEPRLVALPATHPLAAAERITVADLAPLELLQDPDAVPEWRAERLRLGLPPVRAAGVPTLHAVEEKLEHVAAGRGITILPESTTRFYRRPDVVYRPVDGLPPNEVVLAWPAHRTSPALDVTVAQAHTLANAHTLRASLVGEEVLDGRPASA
ncbi:LysR substrate-binding domain-containing protein [Promicromonospora sp. Populi]|uniref:LysR substrate-binding domain-containing protein n=1 Tax=Promicromonospora sp. Populi TaxID=3239420 RepID=UPI0034E24CAF